MENIGWDVVEGRELPERWPANNDHYFMIRPEITTNDDDIEIYKEILVEKIVSVFLSFIGLSRKLQKISFRRSLVNINM